MWRPYLRWVARATAAGALVVGMAAEAPACLFPCLWPHCCGWGFGVGAYAPPPVYAPAPVYAPVPYSPCGPAGCATYYSPNPCCVPCCDPCGPGGCPTGSCGVSYSPGTEPIPDSSSTRPRTYSEPEQVAPDQSTDDMPPDDFVEPQRQDGQSSGTGTQDRFSAPITPMGSGDGSTAPRPVTPMGEGELDDSVTLRVIPVRSRVFARAQYRIPQVARLHVAPGDPGVPTPESRVASR